MTQDTCWKSSAYITGQDKNKTVRLMHLDYCLFWDGEEEVWLQAIQSLQAKVRLLENHSEDSANIEQESECCTVAEYNS